MCVRKSGRPLLPLLALVTVTAQRRDQLSCAHRAANENFVCGNCAMCKCLPDGNLTRTADCCLKISRHAGFGAFLIPMQYLAHEICTLQHTTSRDEISRKPGELSVLVVSTGVIFLSALALIVVFFALFIISTSLYCRRCTASFVEDSAYGLGERVPRCP